MNKEINIEIALTIVNAGNGSRVLKLAKSTGVTGGTILLGRGSVHNRLLEMLGIHDIRKEIVLTVANSDLINKSLTLIEETLNFQKNNTGIAFSMPLTYFYGSQNKENIDKKKEVTSMYNCITVIVDKGKGEEVVDAANKAGSKGCTIINGRGAGTHETSKVFSMEIEPEKEIVLILAENEITDKIVEQIKTDLDIAKPGHGIIFVQNVNQTYGMKRPLIED